MKRPLPALALLCACSATPPMDGLATARFDLTQAPNDASCVDVTVTGATRAVTKSFSLVPGTNTSSLTATGLPIGQVVVSGAAYNLVCGSVTGATQPTWVVNPVSATFTAAGPNTVSLTLVRNGQATLGLNFQDDSRTVSTLATGMNTPAGVVADNAGNLYVADSANNEIRKVVIATGTVTTFAGTTTSGEVDGTGGAARFNAPFGLAIDTAAGNLYVSDGGGCTIRKIVIATAAVTTIAGQACNSQSADGTGTAARFLSPFGLALDGLGNLYVADQAAIRAVSLSTAAVTTVAGNVGQASGYADGSASSARFGAAKGLAWDGGALYIVDAVNNLVRKLSGSPGTVSTVAGSTATAEADGVATGASFSAPYGIAADGQGNLLVADQGGDTVRKVVESNGVVVTVAGTAGVFGTADGTGSAARFNAPLMVAIDSGGVAYVTDNSSSIRKMQ